MSQAAEVMGTSLSTDAPQGGGDHADASASEAAQSDVALMTAALQIPAAL